MRMACSTGLTKILPSPQYDLDLHLWQEVDDIFGAAVELCVALLAAEAFDFYDG